MISIMFSYFKKGEGVKSGEKIFDSPSKASRFCWSMMHRKDIHLDGWKCDSPSENEYMTSKVNLTRINGF